MVSTVGKHASPRQLQYSAEQGKAESKIQSFPQTRQKMSDEKFIVTVQICLRCGKELPLKRGRKNCPDCQGLLRIRTMVLKVL